MLFQSDYWLAANISERKETITDFLETDSGIRTLVIIEKNIETDLVTLVDQIISEGDFACNLSLVFGEDNVRMYESSSDDDEVGIINHMKTIYVCSALDNYSINLLRTFTPILALFV